MTEVLKFPGRMEELQESESDSVNLRERVRAKRTVLADRLDSPPNGDELSPMSHIHRPQTQWIEQQTTSHGSGSLDCHLAWHKNPWRCNPLQQIILRPNRRPRSRRASGARIRDRLKLPRDDRHFQPNFWKASSPGWSGSSTQLRRRPFQVPIQTVAHTLAEVRDANPQHRPSDDNSKVLQIRKAALRRQ